MAQPENHDDDPLQPALPPAPAEPPLPAQSPEEFQAEQMAMLDELVKHLPQEDATPASPTEEIQALPFDKLDRGLDVASLPDAAAKWKKDRLEHADQNAAQEEFLQQADEFVESEPPPAPEPADQEPPPAAKPPGADAYDGFWDSLPTTQAPTAADAPQPREFQGEPGRDFGQQTFPQGDAQNEVASAEADLRSATELFHREHLLTMKAVVDLCVETANELLRLRAYLEQNRL